MRSNLINKIHRSFQKKNPGKLIHLSIPNSSRFVLCLLLYNLFVHVRFVDKLITHPKIIFDKRGQPNNATLYNKHLVL